MHQSYANKRSLTDLTGIMLAMLLACLPALGAWAQDTVQSASPGHIIVLQSAAGGPYAEFTDTFRSMLRKLDPARAATIRVVILGQPRAQNWRSLSDRDLLIAVGTQATRATLVKHGQAPLLSVLIPKTTFDELVTAAADNNTSAIYLDQPAARYLLLAKAVVPNLKTVGVILGPSNTNEISALTAAAKAQGLKLATASMSPAGENPLSALAALLEDSQVILALPDPAIYNRYTLPPVLLTTYRYHVPLIGFSASLANAGAMATVYSDPGQIAQQAAEMLQTGKSRLGHGGFYPRYFRLSFNPAVANALNIILSAPVKIKSLLQQQDAGP